MLRIWIKSKVFGMIYKTLHNENSACFLCCLKFSLNSLAMFLDLSVILFQTVRPVPCAWNLCPQASLTILLPDFVGTFLEAPAVCSLRTCYLSHCA